MRLRSRSRPAAPTSSRDFVAIDFSANAFAPNSKESQSCIAFCSQRRRCERSFHLLGFARAAFVPVEQRFALLSADRNSLRCKVAANKARYLRQRAAAVSERLH